MTGAELVIVLVAAVAGSIAKAVTGMGLPIITIPIAALFVSLDDAVVVIALPNMLANLVLAVGAREHRGETRDLPLLVGYGMAGAVVGTLAFVSVPEEPLVVLLTLAVLAYVATFLANPELRTPPERSRRWSPLVGSVAGVFQGAIGISGPIVGSWIHSYRLGRGAHIFAVTTLFFLTGATQFVVLVASGELTGRLTATLLACVPVLAAIPLGASLRRHVSARAFDLAIVALLAGSAVALCLRTFL